MLCYTVFGVLEGVELTSGYAGRAFHFPRWEPISDLTSSSRSLQHQSLSLLVSNLSTDSQISSWHLSNQPRSGAQAAMLARLVTFAAEQFRAAAPLSLTFVRVPDIQRDLAAPLQTPYTPQAMVGHRWDELQYARNVLNRLRAIEPSVEITRVLQLQYSLKLTLTMTWRCSVK